MAASSCRAVRFWGHGREARRRVGVVSRTGMASKSSTEGGIREEEFCIAFIGVGALGYPIASRIAQKRVDWLSEFGGRKHTNVTFKFLCSTTAHAKEQAEHLNADSNVTLVTAKPVCSMRDAMQGASILISCLPTSSEVTERAEEVAQLQSSPPSEDCGIDLWIDLTSGDPSRSLKTSKLMKERGIDFLDCGVSGGPRGAAAGTMTSMVGGESDALLRAMPLIKAFSKSVVCTGKSGSGHALKCVNNAMMASNIITSSLGIAALKAYGIDPADALCAINNSSGRSWATIDRLAKYIVPQKFNYGFSLELMAKDVRTARKFITEFSLGPNSSTAIDGLRPIAWVDDYIRGALEEATLRKDSDHTELAKISEALMGTTLASEKEDASDAERTLSLQSHGIKGICFDMAGTTVDEGGLVYATLLKTMRNAGLEVSDSEFRSWHGADKYEVVEHFCDSQQDKCIDPKNLYDIFFAELENAYEKPGNVKAVAGAVSALKALKDSGIKVGLQTGYGPTLARKLGSMTKLDYDHITTATEAGGGRPAPFMIFDFMKSCKIQNVKLVAKVGDTPRDILEAKNAGCGLSIGVETGAGNRKELLAAGADVVLKDVTRILP